VADVDGDGLGDTVTYEYVDGAVLSVCTASGDRDRISTSGMAETLQLVDVQGDGQADIFYGGNTCCQSFTNMATVEDGEIRTVNLLTGIELTLTSGIDRGSNGRPRGHAFGCRDIDRDGVGDLVQVVVNADGDHFRWAKRAYEIEGATATEIAEWAGVVDRGPGDDTSAVVKAAGDLIHSSCERVAD
jgi:hypothetical protein